MRFLQITAALLAIVALACGGMQHEGANAGDCADGMDNDGDGLSDCMDADCSDAPSCATQHPAGPTGAARFRQWRAELLSNTDGIRNAELAYEDAFGQPIATDAWPREVSALDGEAIPWQAGSGFDVLGWAPDGATRGVYRVDVDPAGADFTVHGWMDLDQDGNYAHATASKSSHVVLVTPDDVF